eukprot:s2429_g14.t1
MAGVAFARLPKWIVDPMNLMTDRVVDFLVVAHPAQSESAKTLRFDLLSLLRCHGHRCDPRPFVGGSSVVSGLAGAACLVVVLCRLDAQSSAMSSATSRFGAGSGKGALVMRVEGAVVIGTSVMAGCCPLCVEDCAAVVGSASSCCEGVCVSVVVVLPSSLLLVA